MVVGLTVLSVSPINYVFSWCPWQESNRLHAVLETIDWFAELATERASKSRVGSLQCRYGAGATLSEDKGSGCRNLRRCAQSLPTADLGHRAMRFVFVQECGSGTPAQQPTKTGGRASGKQAATATGLPSSLDRPYRIETRERSERFFVSTVISGPERFASWGSGQ
jgi:hypothetical protein